MSPAALYVHFGSKEEALFAITRMGHEAVLELARAASSSNVSTADRLFEVTRTFVDWHATHHLRARAINYDLASLTPEHQAFINRLRVEIKSVFLNIIEAGIADGTFTAADPDLEATAIISLGVDLARWYRPDGPWSPGRVADRYAHLALDMLSSGSRVDAAAGRGSIGL
jgi:AcrR family transcriptional regulator